MKAAAILGLMTLLVPPKRQEINKESEADARARYAVIAGAIATEAKGDKTLARYLLTIVRHESSFVRGVHSGKLRGDAGKAVCVAQLLVGRGTDRFTGRFAHQLVGTSPAATARCINTAAAYVRFARRRCKTGGPACVFQVYGGVRRASDPRIRARVNTYAKLRRLEAR